MNTKDILSWLALVLGAAIIIGLFFIFLKDMPDDLFVLNLSVSLLVYALFYVEVLVPWVDWQDKSKSRIGSIGLRWTVTWIYAILAIGSMVVCNTIFNVGFSAQLIIHGMLLLILILGISGALHASDKVTSVYNKEMAAQKGITEMRRAFGELKQMVYNSSNTPQEVRSKIEKIEEDLRYISPSEHPEAAALEKQFSEMVRDFCINVNSYSENSDRVMSLLEKVDYILKSRKSIYSL